MGFFLEGVHPLVSFFRGGSSFGGFFLRGGSSSGEFFFLRPIQILNGVDCGNS